MKSRSAAALACLVALAACAAAPRAPPPAAGQTASDRGGVQSRVFNGVPADPKPWQVALYKTTLGSPLAGHFCGGVFIASDWVLTAAHCLFKPGRVSPYFKPAMRENGQSGDYLIAVYAGSPHLADGSGVSLPVDYAVANNGFDLNYDDDIALVHVVRQTSLGRSHGAVGPIPLPSAGDDTSIGGSVFVYGWGYQEARASVSADLYVAELYIGDPDACSAFWRQPDSGTEPATITVNSQAMICAQGHSPAGRTAATVADACTNDSGGPLVVRRPDAYGNQIERLVGLVSFGRKCGVPGAFGGYTRVSHYSQWIADNMRLPG